MRPLTSKALQSPDVAARFFKHIGFFHKMQFVVDQFTFSPSDLTNFVACEHLTQLELAVAFSNDTRPSFGNAYADLIKRKGEEHERNFLEALRAEGHGISQVGLGENHDFVVAARATAEAMRAGSAYVYQAVFLAGGWHGIADFLERIERPSTLGPWSYQVLDTKLARHPRAEHALQLCFYSHALGQIQKIEPEIAYVVLGTRERFPIRIANVSAYYRRVRQRFELGIASRSQTAPYPCEHCPLCDFRKLCEERYEREDHLVRVAGIRRDQIGRLWAKEIDTLTKLAQAHPDTRIPKMPAPTFHGLREQATLQVESQGSETIQWRELPIESGRGFAVLAPRSKGDVVLDLEGHPFFEPARGMEFLFGVLTLDGTEPQYEPFWAHDRNGERRALEKFVDLVHTRLRVYPDLHVYHFGVYEPAAIKRLMGEHATRESEIDAFCGEKSLSISTLYYVRLYAQASPVTLSRTLRLYSVSHDPARSAQAWMQSWIMSDGSVQAITDCSRASRLITSRTAEPLTDFSSGCIVYGRPS
jgi:predicted RecB family nuclease